MYGEFERAVAQFNDVLARSRTSVDNGVVLTLASNVQCVFL